AHLRRDFQPVPSRHRDVEQHNVGRQLGDQSEAFVPTACFTGDFEPIFGVDRFDEALPDQRVILYYDYSGHTCPSIEYSRLTRVPPSTRLPTCKTAPIRAARSR